MKIIDGGYRIGFQIEEGDAPELVYWFQRLIEATAEENSDKYLAVLTEMSSNPELAAVAAQLLKMCSDVQVH